MKVLVTGANGFVGRRVVNRLLDSGHEVVAAFGPGVNGGIEGPSQVLECDLTSNESVAAIAETRPDAVLHLAAVSSGGEARRSPLLAMEVNTVGTARLAEALGTSGFRGRFVYISTGEVYAPGDPVPRVETDPLAPGSPYSVSKLAGEFAILEAGARYSMEPIVLRAFPHSGPDQEDRFVLPAFTRKILMAKRIGAPAVGVGNMNVVREFMHVEDVVEAYLRVLESEAMEAGMVLNVASSRGYALRRVFDTICDCAGARVMPETDTTLVRARDAHFVVGSGERLSELTGWNPATRLETLVEQVVKRWSGED